MWLKTRIFLLITLFFGILYGVITGVGTWMGTGSALTYLTIAFVFLGIQCPIGPTIVGPTMKVRWASAREESALHKIVTELANRDHLPKPKVGTSQPAIPNAFVLGRSQRDGRVCATQGALESLNIADSLKKLSIFSPPRSTTA